MERHRTLLLLAEAPAPSCELKEPAGESLKDMEVIDEYIADSESDQETVEKELPSCKPQDPAVKENPSCELQDPELKEQPSCGPQDPVEEPQPSCGPQDPVEEQQSSTGPQNKEVEDYEDAEIPSRSQSPSDSWEIQDSVSQYSVTSAGDLNQMVSVKRAKKRRHSSSSEEDKRRSNYAEILITMLNKRPRVAEPILDYFYGKMYLINNCGIRGRNAVDCILHGLGDHPLRYPAEAKQFRDPDDLLEYLKTSKIEYDGKNEVKRKRGKRAKCFNCELFGHLVSECPKPINQSRIDESIKKAKQFRDPDDLLEYLKTPKIEYDGKNEVKRKRGRNAICFNCEEFGHLVSECPKSINQSRINKSIKICDNCNRIGHSIETCNRKEILKQLTKTYCPNCKGTDHKIHNCPQPKKRCDLCFKLGHFSETCRKPNTLIQKETKIIVCYNCQRPGHKSRVCRDFKVTCEFCFQLGHSADVCKLKPKELTTEKSCYRGNQVGHTKSACPKRARNYDLGMSNGTNNIILSNNSSTDLSAVVQKTEENKTSSPWIWS